MAKKRGAHNKHHAYHQVKKHVAHEEKADLVKPESVKRKPRAFSPGFIAAAAVIIALILYFIFFFGKDIANNNLPALSKDKADVELIVSSHGAIDKQVEGLILPIISEFKDQVFLHISFLGITSDGKLTSPNGEQELAENIIQICAQEDNPLAIGSFVLCRNKDLTSDWKACALEQGLSQENIKQCIDSNKGLDLITKSLKTTKEKGITSSPSVLINGNKFSYYPGSDTFERELCKKIKDNSIAVCKNLPEVKAINIIIVSDKRCSDCDINANKLIQTLTGVFPGLKPAMYDYSDAEGKKIFEKTGLTFLPIALFDSEILIDSGYSRVSRYLEKRGEYYSLKIGAIFDPTKEICDNKIDDTNDGKIDCLDPDCSNSLICRAEIPKKLDLFIMSDCPYGREAVKAMEPIMTALGSKIDFNIHYIANEAGEGKFSSLHGDYEVVEDIRQLCVKQISPDRWFSYVLCRSKNPVKTTDWNTCADNLALDKTTVTACVDGAQGKSLLSADIKAAQSLGISASPTWMANNKFMFNGIDAESVKNQFCQSNPGLEGCEKTLSSNNAVAPGSCG